MTVLATHPSLDQRANSYATHEVMNQPGSLENYDLYSADKPLCDAVHVYGADWAANLLPGYTIVPSGVVAVNGAQSKGCSYCYAG